jgi:hypothetical protein
MSKKAEYLRQAEQCRALAEQMMLEEHRNQLLEMAASWERLARVAEGAVGDAKPASNEPGSRTEAKSSPSASEETKPPETEG